MALPPGKGKRPAGKVPAGPPGKVPARSPGAPPGKVKRPVKRPGTAPGAIPAGEKPQAKKVEMNRQSIVMASIAGVLAIVSIVLLVQSGFRLARRWQFRDGLLQHDMGRPEAAVAPLKAAIDWDSDNPEPKLLLAKIHVEDDNYGEAEDLYNAVLGSEYGGQHPEAHVGLGVMYLRQADRAKSAEEASAFLAKAEGEFKQAGAAVESHIGLATARLIRAVKVEGASGEAAASAFADALAKAKSDPPTLDGCIDLTAGQAASMYSAEQYNAQGALAARQWLQYDPLNPSAMSAVLLYDGQLFEFDHAKDDTPTAVKEVIEAQTFRIGQYVRSRLQDTTVEAIDRRAALAYVLSVVHWRIEQGLWHDAQDAMTRQMALNEIAGLVETMVIQIYFVQRLCEVPVFGDRNLLLAGSGRDITNIITRVESDETFKQRYPDVLPLLHATVGQVNYVMGTGGGLSDRAMYYGIAVGSLKKAVELAPTEYSYLRNLALALGALGKPEEGRAHLEKLKELAGEDAERVKDLGALVEYLNKE